jgi:hypothetical protein
MQGNLSMATDGKLFKATEASKGGHDSSEEAQIESDLSPKFSII